MAPEVAVEEMPEEVSSGAMGAEEIEFDVTQEEGSTSFEDGNTATPANIVDEVTSYIVTLDANGGYFENEWDDVLGESFEITEVLNKAIPVGGTVVTFPIYGINEQDSQSKTISFAGWSLERDGLLVSQGYEEYVPANDCVLYAVWTVEEEAAAEDVEEDSAAASTTSEPADPVDSEIPEQDVDTEPEQSEGNVAERNEEQVPEDNRTIKIEEKEEAVNEGPIVKEDVQLAESVTTEPQMASMGSVSGNSKVTWSKNSMPVAFDNTNVSLRKNAYLAATQDGYMRVAYNGKSVVIEYYDSSFRMIKKGTLSMELNIWGDFYAGEDAYYIVEGKNNKDCVDGTEVLRIIKYDFNWKRLGAGRVLAQEGWEYEVRYPFDYSCINMTEVNGKLYVITGREGYVDSSVGQGHQGMMLIRMDEEAFDTEIVYGDFWHSFAQYIDHKGTDLYICEQSEGSRCTMLSDLIQIGQAQTILMLFQTASPFWTMVDREHLHGRFLAMQA